MNREQIEKFAIGIFREDKPEFGGVYVVIGLILFLLLVLVLVIIIIFLIRLLR